MVLWYPQNLSAIQLLVVVVVTPFILLTAVYLYTVPNVLKVPLANQTFIVSRY